MSRASVVLSITCSFAVSVFIGVACSPLGSGFAVMNVNTSSSFEAQSKMIYVSDLSFESVSNGWGPIEVDRSNGEKDLGDGRPMAIGGQVFQKGFGVHAPSQIRLVVPRGCYGFVSSVGVDDETNGSGSVVFQIRSGEQVLARSELVRFGDSSHPISVTVVEGQTLTLDVEDGGDGSSHDHGDWGDAHFLCGDSVVAPGEGDGGQCPAPTEPAFFVAENGSDSSDGSLAHPFQSLRRARDAMRASPVKKTFVRDGLYPLAQTLDLSASDSGTAFENYPCEKPVISGGKRLTGFKSEGNGLYSLQTDAITYLDLFVGGERQRPATTGLYDPANPFRSGWYFVEGLVGDGKRAYQFKSGDLTASDMIPGVLSQTFSWDRQSDSIVEVDRIDFATRTVHLKSDVWFVPKTGTFRLLNNPKFIRNTGEFSWSAADNRLYLKPKNPATFESDGVLLPQLATLMSLTGVNGLTIRGLTFRDVPYSGKAISLIDSNQIQIGGNKFENVGLGISLSGSSHNLIAGNTFRHLGNSGIDMNGGSNANQIYANDMRYLGEVNKYVGGITANGVYDNWIAHNYIQYSARYGISVKTWDAASRNERNTIEYNKILDSCQETADGGAIEMLGRLDIKTGNVIRGNYIERYGGLGASSGSFYATKGFGIYLDDKTGGVLVSGNFIKSSPGMAHIYVHAGDDNTIENNFGILDGEDLEFLRLERTIDYATSVGTVVRKNVIYYEKQTSDYSFYSSGGEASVDQNLIYRSGKFRDGSGGDANSLIADPQFVDPASGNYRLKPSSPAFQLGIKDLEWSRMGPEGYLPSSDHPKFW